MTKRKRGQGEGSIYKRKDGRWASVITVGKNPDGSQKRRFFYGKTRQEVADKLNKALSNMKTGDYVEPNKLTISDWLDTWLWDYKSTSLKPKTIESYNWIIHHCIKPIMGTLVLQSVRPDNIQSMINTLSKQGLSARTVKYSHTILHAAFEQAVKNSLLNKNPSKHCILPKKEVKEIKVLTINEQEKFMQSIEDHRLKAAFFVLLFTGCRIGELLALTWKNVNYDAGTIKITQTLQRVNLFDKGSDTKTKLIFVPPKTEKGNRTIPLLESITSLLKSHEEKQLQEQNLAEEIYEYNDLVFATELGKPIDPKNFTRTFKSLLRKADLDESTKIHSLRHTFATRGLENGIELKVMQEILGHSSISITGDIYSHVLPDKKRESINRLSNLFNISSSDKEDKN
ncbi:MAG: site-specific integrase [Clostridiaceae bacterium]|nr:site-specific integrase [Clostridiaceae bacterium]